MKDIPISPMKVIEGQSGRYWCVGESDTAALLVRVGFERGPALVGENSVDVDVLQLNVLYFGPQFTIPAPFKFIETRPYPLNGKKIQGALIGKMYLPLGEFNQSRPELFAAAVQRAHVAESSLDLLYKAAGLKIVSSLSNLLELLSENLQKDPVEIEPRVFVGVEYDKYKAQIKATAAAKAEAMKANLKPQATGEPEAEADPE